MTSSKTSRWTEGVPFGSGVQEQTVERYIFPLTMHRPDRGIIDFPDQLAVRYEVRVCDAVHVVLYKERVPAFL